MKNISLFLVFFLSLDVGAYYEHLLHKPYAQRIVETKEMYRVLKEKDSVLVMQEIEKIKNFAKENKDNELEMEMSLFKASFTKTKTQPVDYKIAMYEEVLEEAKRKSVDYVAIRALGKLADLSWKVEKNYEKAFHYYALLGKELNKHSQDYYPFIAHELGVIGDAYYYFKDYNSAKKYLLEAVNFQETELSSYGINKARNTLGLCYQNEGNLDSSDYYFKLIVLSSFPESKVWVSIAKGNLGANYFYRKQFDKAIPLLEFDYYTSLKRRDENNAAGAAIKLGGLYLELNYIDSSRFYIERAKASIDKLKFPLSRLAEYYPLASNWYKASNLFETAILYQDSASKATEQFNQEFNALKLLRAQQAIAGKEEELRKSSLALEREKGLRQRNFLITLVIGMLFFISIFYFRQKRKQTLKDLKLQAANKDLEIAMLDLGNFQKNIAAKNKLIERLKKKSKDNAASAILIEELQSSVILTEKDWQDFQLKFNKAYPLYLLNAKEKFPELTESEVRFFALIRLKLSSKEIASMLGVSVNTVHVLRHRIKKKMGLPEASAIEEIVLSIDK